jgi:hypothetical protein
MPGSDERRDAERVRVPGDLQGEVLVYQPLTLRELSLVGAVIETAFPLPPQSSHNLRLALGPTNVVANARVVDSCVSQIGDGRVTYRSGVEFIDPPDAVLDAITALLKHLRATQV